MSWRHTRSARGSNIALQSLAVRASSLSLSRACTAKVRLAKDPYAEPAHRARGADRQFVSRVTAGASPDPDSRGRPRSQRRRGRRAKARNRPAVLPCPAPRCTRPSIAAVRCRRLLRASAPLGANDAIRPSSKPTRARTPREAAGALQSSYFMAIAGNHKASAVRSTSPQRGEQCQRILVLRQGSGAAVP